ncbi:MAG: hypothetical protein GY765_14865 [bacterium]|nr:hypothetical protein [bacterium]
MKKIILAIALVFALCVALVAEVVTFPNLLKPDSITVNDGQMIITEGASVYIHSLENFKLQKTFGSLGEGPREFKITSYSETGLIIDPHPGVLVISSVGKLSLFNRDGEYIKEMKAVSNAFGNRFLGLDKGSQSEKGGTYVGTGTTMTKKTYFMTINLYDEQLEKIKEVSRWPVPYQMGLGTRLFSRAYIFRTAGDKILVAGEKEFKIDFYDADANSLYSVTREVEPVKTSGALKDEIADFYKTKPYYKHLKPLTFDDYLPAIRDVLVKDQKIYVVTYRKIGDDHELLVLDMKGKLLKETSLPLVRRTVLALYPYAVDGGKLYQLVEDEESEEWELRITPIK